MAKTKRKRKTKHRGNAVGMVESRGRTGRRPTSEEKGGTSKGSSKGGSKEPVAHRLDRPPSWKGALFRAVVAAGAFFGFLVLLFDRPARPSAAIAVMMIAVYTPLGYFTDMWLHRRRIKRKAEEGRK